MVLIDITGEIIELYIEMASYILIGLLFVGLLHITITKDMVLKHIGNKNIWSVIKASLLGVPLPLCSCGVIPTSVYMSNNGASKGSVVSFLISTPQTGIDSIIATYGMMGWVFAIFRPIAAFIMGIAGGTVVNFMDRSESAHKKTGQKTSPDNTVVPGGLQIYRPATGNSTPARQDTESSESCDDGGGCGSEDKPDQGKLRKMFNYSFVEFLDDISVHFLVGLIISGLIAYFVPAGFFDNSTFSNGIVGMLLMIAIGIPMYVCATASIPIAVTLILKGFSPGLAFVFLAVGPATNAASFTIITKALGKKLAFVYLGVISILAIVFGYVLDWLFSIINIDLQSMMVKSQEHSLISEEIKIGLSLLFLVFLLLSLYRKLLRNRFSGNNKEETKMEDTKTYIIEGMSCNHCAMTVQNAIEKVKGVLEVKVDAGSKKAEIKGNFSTKEIASAVKSAGYTLVL